MESPTNFQTWLQQYRGAFLYSAQCSFSNPICFWFVWCWRTMNPGKIFTSFAEFQGIVSVNDFRLPIWHQELLQPLCVSWESFCFARIRLDPLGGQVLHLDCISMIVSKFKTFTENFVICCYQVTKIFCTRYGSAIASSARCPCNFGPLTDLAISVFRGNEFKHCACPNPHFSWMWALKILHETNWRVSLCVQELFHPQDFSEFLQPLRDVRRQRRWLSSKQRVSPFYRGFLFIWFFGFELAWQRYQVWQQTTGLSVLSFPQHLHLTQVLDGNRSHSDLPFLKSHCRVLLL